MATETQLREKLKSLMALTVADEHKYHNATYAAVRPQSILTSYKSGQLWRADCSNGCRDLCRLAHVPDDPAGYGYGPYGNSSSIWLHLHNHITLAEANVGDIIVFGRYAGELHACMIYDLKNRANPVVWNFGTQGQPYFSTLEIERAGHPGAIVTICKLNLPPDPPPTPQEKLRARTGFYSWVAWRLGEGPWKKYAPADKRVRPNVPKRIPLKWWKHYVKFLLNRKKANKPVKKSALKRVVTFIRGT